MRALLLCGCALLVLATRPAFATTFHVAPDSSGDVLNIQAAIDAATSGDEILLSDGTFTGDGNWDLNFGTKDLVVRSEHGYEATSVHCGFQSSMIYSSHRGFILEGGQTAATRIEDITIERSYGPEDGGSIRCVGASPTIRRVRIRDNVRWGRGGGIFIQDGAPVIEDSVFEREHYTHITSEGAAIYSTQSWLSVQRCSFAMHGWPLVYVDGGVLTDCTFDETDQDDSQFGNSVRVAGGDVSIVRCAFRWAFGYGVTVDSTATVLIGSSLFEHNFADTGPGVFGRGTITIRNTTFRHNFADDTAAISFWGGALSLDHCVFFNNGTCFAPFPGGDSSALYARNATLHVSHCTFVRNRNNCGRQGSSITIDGGTASIDHTIIAFGGQLGPPDGAIHCIGAPASLAVTCTDIFGNDGGDWTGCIAGIDGTNGNISLDPLFCDLAGGDLSVNAASPCAPEHSGECDLIGALGVGCGPTALESHSWGSIKALYR